MNKDYLEIFNRFFSKEYEISSTYKPVFLSALLDLSHYVRSESYPNSWIEKNDDVIKIQLDFFAVWFIKYYQKIQNLEIKHTTKITDHPTKNDDIDIIGLIENQNITKADFESLSQSRFEDFRKEVITKGIKPEVLKKLSKDFEGIYKVEKQYIIIQIDVLEFMNNNSEWIKKELGIKIIEHLKKYNNKISNTDVGLIDKNNSFFEYVKSFRKNIFLIGLNTTSLEKDFENTILKKINLKYHPKIQESVSVWGLLPTDDNKRIWDQIKKYDIVLFCKNNICFAKSVVRDVLHDRNESKKLWAEVRELLIVFEEIHPLEIDLQDTMIKLIDPTVPNAYNFPITRVADKTIDMMCNLYGGIESSLDNMSTFPIGSDIHDVNLTSQYAITKIRVGQDNFRKQVLRNYRNTCAVCDISEEKLLEASHILRVHYHESAGDVSNGICLCVLHHKMFDRNYMYFDKSYNLEFLPRTPEYLKETCTKKHIDKSSCNVMPSQEYLEKFMMTLKENE